MAKPPLGKLAAEAIGMAQIPRLAKAVLDGFRALDELTGTTSDALDECGIEAVVPGSLLKATDARARVVGQAITVLNRKSAERGRAAGSPISRRTTSPGRAMCSW